ncbi:MAG: DNA-processing protein DprA [Elusimicrobiota bacterium]|jgi:DNA processing protein|nr:DNA-processing protein DprA [Elusimicrobiota bacterium]
MDEEKLSLLKLFLTGDVGNVRISKLIEKFGDVRAIFKASKKDLLSVSGIGDNIANSILKPSLHKIAEQELITAEKSGIKIVFYTDKDYPTALNHFSDKPLVLYVKGKITKEDISSVAIVGSRKITPYGKTVTSEFASYFARLKITIISGLARGVDTHSHLAALENNSRTVAVLGNGLLVFYPNENRFLQEKIAQNGAVISEFPLHVPPDKGNFPKRNRIVAGLAEAILVTEADLKSGSLITARIGAEYGKDVFAVPGNIHSMMSQGTNALISNGAFPALSPDIVADYMDWSKKNESSIKTKAYSSDKFENKILDLIEQDADGLHPDIIAQKLNTDISKVNCALLNLELSGFIKTSSGQTYIRVL